MKRMLLVVGIAGLLFGMLTVSSSAGGWYSKTTWVNQSDPKGYPWARVDYLSGTPDKVYVIVEACDTDNNVHTIISGTWLDKGESVATRSTEEFDTKWYKVRVYFSGSGYVNIGSMYQPCLSCTYYGWTKCFGLCL